MKLGLSQARTVGFDEEQNTWRHLNHPLFSDVVSLLSIGSGELRQFFGEQSSTPDGLPFVPSTLRSFALWEEHMIKAAKGMVSKFGSGSLQTLAAAYEKVTGNVLAPMRPRANYYRYPQYYMGNGRSLIADQDELEWPPFSTVLDFELEIGLIISKQIRDCSPEEAQSAIGGLCIINDWSARDTQWDDTRRGTFGGVVKAKTFAGSMSAIVVTSDDVLSQFSKLQGRVRVNGEIWCEGQTAGAMYEPWEMVRYAAMGETLYPGEILATGCLPGCSGLELGRFPKKGDLVQLEIEGIGSLANRIKC